jgi:hypothetical protein
VEERQARGVLAFDDAHIRQALLGDRPLEAVTTADLHAVLAPLWTEQNETASRLKQRLSPIFDWAKGAGTTRMRTRSTG